MPARRDARFLRLGKSTYNGFIEAFNRSNFQRRFRAENAHSFLSPGPRGRPEQLKGWRK